MLGKQWLSYILPVFTLKKKVFLDICVCASASVSSKPLSPPANQPSPAASSVLCRNATGSEDNFQGSVLSFCPVGRKDGIWHISLGRECLHPLSHLAEPQLFEAWSPQMTSWPELTP